MWRSSWGNGTEKSIAEIQENYKQKQKETKAFENENVGDIPTYLKCDYYTNLKSYFNDRNFLSIVNGKKERVYLKEVGTYTFPDSSFEIVFSKLSREEQTKVLNLILSKTKYIKEYLSLANIFNVEIDKKLKYICLDLEKEEVYSISIVNINNEYKAKEHIYNFKDFKYIKENYKYIYQLKDYEIKNQVEETIKKYI